MARESLQLARTLKLQWSAYPDNEWKADTWIRTAVGPGLILTMGRLKAPLGMARRLSGSV